MVQESLGFNNVEVFSDRPPSQIKIVKGDGDCSFRAISYFFGRHSGITYLH